MADGVDAVHRLKSIDPPLYLSPSVELSQTARCASEYIFSSLSPFTPKSPFPRLLSQGYDHEQIWQQIDLQSTPLISRLSRQVKKFEKNPEEISKLFDGVEKKSGGLETKAKGLERETADVEDLDEEDLEELEEDEDEDEEEEEEEEEAEAGVGGGGVEDKFLKIKELEEYLEDDEAREFGTKKKKRKSKVDSEDDDEEEVDEVDEEEEDNEFGLLGIADGDGEDDELGDARYDDFFGNNKKAVQKKKSRRTDESDDSDMDFDTQVQKKENKSTFEKELEKQQSKIEEMEKTNMEPKTWTMQGEVTSAKRPKNSALEVDLDFEHNVRPAPVITEEVTANLEELIQKRILEGHFDDVQKAPSLLSKAPKEVKEMDENKSKKGLGEVYAEEYVEKTGLVSAAISFSDEQKKEAGELFKRLCLKLDALSHFHFTPKPVIEDMSIQANVPALAMEEIAPLAVSDATMLAPEEVFSGKGDIKEETELTQAERKRRRANKKRKFKAESADRTAKKPKDTAVNHDENHGKNES